MGVTSVALTMPGIFAVAGSPITHSGTFVVTILTQPKNTVWAGPTTGANAAPTFRALVDADIHTSRIHADNQTLLNVANGSITVDWSNLLLNWVNVGGGTFTTVDWGNCMLNDRGAVNSVDWKNRILVDSGGQFSVDYQNKLLRDGGGLKSVDWANRECLDSGQNVVFGWGPNSSIQLSGSLPTADPADGTNSLWMNPVTRALMVGT